MVKAASGVFIQPVAHDGVARLSQWQRVYHAVRWAIEREALAAGDRLPSARELARDWQVARGAVDEAFAQLQLEGLIERRVGDGSYVAERARPPVPPRRGEPSTLARRVLQQAGRLSLPSARRECAFVSQRPPALHPRATDIDAFPLDVWRRLLLATASEQRRDLLADVPPVGLPALAESIVRHLALQRGVACRPEQVLVLATPAEGLNLMCRLLLAPGDTVWVEDPSHPSLPWLLATFGAKVRGVPLDAEGFDLDAARRGGGKAGLVYLHPLNQYPLAQRSSVARGDALLAWARREQAWIVEAMFNDELWPREAQPAALVRRDPERVFLLGTFEGIMFPSLRLAYLVVPQGLLEPFRDAQTLWGPRAAAATQAAMAEFIDRGHLAEHLNQQRARLAARRVLLHDELLARLPAGVQAGPLTPAPHLCLHLPPGSDDVAWARHLRQAGVVVEPLAPMCWSTPPRPGLVLGYAGWDDAVLRASLVTLRRTLAAGLPTQPQLPAAA